MKVTANEPARDKGLLIPQNMRVPEASAIHSAVMNGESVGAVAEDLSWWESQGRALRALPIRVDARGRHDYVEALVTA